MAISMRIDSVSKTIAPKSICIVVSIRISLCFTFGNMNSSSRVGNVSSSTSIGTMNSWDSCRSNSVNTNSVSNIGDSMTNSMMNRGSICSSMMNRSCIGYSMMNGSSCISSMSNTITKVSSISKMTHSISGIESIGLSLTLGNMNSSCRVSNIGNSISNSMVDGGSIGGNMMYRGSIAHVSYSISIVASIPISTIKGICLCISSRQCSKTDHKKSLDHVA